MIRVEAGFSSRKHTADHADRARMAADKKANFIRGHPRTIRVIRGAPIFPGSLPGLRL